MASPPGRDSWRPFRSQRNSVHCSISWPKTRCCLF